jgi:hypothetical protein
MMGEHGGKDRYMAYYTESNLTASVGKYGPTRKQCYNQVSDQVMIWNLLNSIPEWLGGPNWPLVMTGPSLIEGGRVNEDIYQAILKFQNKHIKDGLSPDGHIDPHEKTLRLLLKLSKEAPPDDSIITPLPSGNAPRHLSGTPIYINPETGETSEHPALEYGEDGVHLITIGTDALKFVGAIAKGGAILAEGTALGIGVLILFITQLNEPPPDLSDPDALSHVLREAAEKTSSLFCTCPSVGSRTTTIVPMMPCSEQAAGTATSTFSTKGRELRPPITPTSKTGVIRGKDVASSGM